MLKKYDLESDIVADGEDVLKMLDEQKYDLVFMDQNMPVMSGVQATKELRSQGDESWIVACSASTMEREKASCLEAGMNDFLSKPITMASLKFTLVNHRDRNKFNN